MTELATRYKIGENLGDARSAREWASKHDGRRSSARLSRSSRDRATVPEAPAEPPPSRVFRVKAPKLSTVSSGPQSSFEAPPTLGGRARPCTHRLPARSSSTRNPRTRWSRATRKRRRASPTTSASSKSRPSSNRNASRAFTAVADVAKKLFEATPDETPVLLEGLVASLASTLRCKQASLSLIRPDGNFEQVVGTGAPSRPARKRQDSWRPSARASHRRRREADGPSSRRSGTARRRHGPRRRWTASPWSRFRCARPCTLSGS